MAKQPPDKRPPGKASGDPADDMALWAEVAKTVRPLPGREAPAPDITPPPKKPRARKPAPAPAKPVAPATPPEPLTHDHQPGLDKAVRKRMRRGQVTLEGRLDLHGMTQVAARTALEAFITTAAAQGKREVLVITGKGRRSEPDETGRDDGRGDGRAIGVLRQRVPDWLNDATLRPLVTGFTPAADKDGGSGALYVRLKRRRDNTT